MCNSGLFKMVCSLYKNSIGKKSWNLMKCSYFYVITGLTNSRYSIINKYVVAFFWPFLSSWCSFPFSKQSPTMDLLWSFPPQTTTTHSATVLWSHNGQNGLDQGQPNSHLKKAIFGEWVFVASSGWWWGNSIFRIIRQMQRPTLIRSIWPFLASVLNFWRMR